VHAPYNSSFSFGNTWSIELCTGKSDFLFKLLEGIGALKASKTTKNHDANQDCITASLSREHDNDIAGQEDQPEDLLEDQLDNDLREVLSAVDKVIY
jgi:hypothetical protein